MCSIPSCASAPPTCVATPPAHRAARLGRVKVVAAPVRIQDARQAMRREHLQQARERRSRPFLRHQDRRVDRTRRIVQRHHQVALPQARHPGEPRRSLMQHHAGQRAPLPLAPVGAAPESRFQQPPALQEQLRPHVATVEPGRPRQVLVEVLGREALIPLAIQRLNPLRLRRCNAVRRRRPDPAIPQPLLSLLAIPMAPAAERPFPNPQQLTSLSLAQLTTPKALVNVTKTPCPGCPATAPTGASGPPRQESPSSPDRSSAT